MAEMTTVQLVVTAIGGGGLLTGVASLATALLNRGKTRAEAGKVLTDQAVLMVNELQEEVKAARAEVAQLRGEARAIAAELYELRTAIFRPDATIDGLKLLALNPAARAGNGGRHYG